LREKKFDGVFVMIDDLIVYQKTYDFLLWIKPTVQRFQKVHKYSLGVQLENAVLDLGELLD